MDTHPVIVVGGGISGMGAAWGLYQRGIPVLVLEADRRVGGMVQSRTQEGFTLDLGPQTLSTRDPKLLQDLQEAGIGSAPVLLRADPVSGERFVVFQGSPMRLPSGPLDLLRTPLLSAKGRVTLLRSAFRRNTHADSGEESIRAFATRRLGKEVADRMVDPFVSGVFAGDPDRVSMAAVFPELVKAEREHGSLAGALRALARSRRQTRQKGTPPPRGIYSFESGLATWPQTIAQMLGPENIRTGASVTLVERDGPFWRIQWDEEDPSGSRRAHEAQAAEIILAVPAHTASHLIRDLPNGKGACDALKAIPSAPVAVVHLAWPRAHVRHPVRGFGLLAPSGEKRKILGSLWPAGLFPGKAPEGQVLTANFVGGARQPAQVELPDEALLSLVSSELEDLLGAQGTPSFGTVSRWVPGIPQYTRGHQDRIRQVESLEASNPGLQLVGNWRNGVSLGACWDLGRKASVKVRPEGHQS